MIDSLYKWRIKDDEEEAKEYDNAQEQAVVVFEVFSVPNFR